MTKSDLLPGLAPGLVVLAEPATMFARAVKAVADQQGGGDAAPAVEAEPVAEPA